MNNKNKAKIKLIFSVIFLIFMIGLTSFFIYNNNNQVRKIPSVNTKIQTTNDNTEQINYINHLPTFREEFHNEDIKANLIIPSLSINILITKTDNNDYYLNHDIYKKSNALGNPFIDYRNNNLQTDKQINIYGHNTDNERYLNDLPFTKLQSYTNKDFFDNNKEVFLDIDEEEERYRVIAVKIINRNDREHMSIVFYDENDYANHLTKMLENSMYYDNTPVDKNSKILVMQACNYNPKGTYIIVICKKTN